MPASTLPLAFDQYSGRKLGKYEILCRLSTGGMSVIFLAFQKGLAGFRKFVVLKQILPDIKGEEEFVRMFLDEAKITAAFNHPNIAQVFDLDIQEGELFLAMEFVPGATLVEVAKACRANNESIPTGFSLMAVRDTAMALQYAHTFTDPAGRKQTVIHRDVAEKNIMVTYEGTTKLLDFGIAKSLAQLGRTTVGMVKGTSGYMSPEQILGEKLDARSDVFSLGVVLHECLTGMRLFHGKSPEEGMMAALKEPISPPSRGNSDVSPELDAVALKALARQRDERYSTAREFARALERAAGSLIWEPEQTSDLISRLFSERRDQTRTLMASSESAQDMTGEHLLRELLGDPPKPVRAVPPLREVPPPPPPPLRKPSLTPAPVQVTTPIVPPPTRSGRGPAQEEPVEIITDSPTPVNRNARKTTMPWDDETTHGSQSQTEMEDQEGLTVPVGSVPQELLDALARQTGTYEATREPPTLSGVNDDTRYSDEHTTPGIQLLRSKAKWVSAVIFIVLMVLVFSGGLLVTGIYRRLSTRRTPLPIATLEAEKAQPTEVPLTAEQADLPPPTPPAQETEEKAAPEEKAEVAPPPAKTEIAKAETPKPEPTKAQPAKAEEPKHDQPRVVVKRPASPSSSPSLGAPSSPEPAVAKNTPPKVEEKKKPAPTTPAKSEEPAEKAAPAAPGLLTLVADPFVSKVLFKSQDLGPSPLFKIPMPAGKHTLKLVTSDSTVRLLTVEIKAGEPTNLRIDPNTLPKE